MALGKMGKLRKGTSSEKGWNHPTKPLPKSATIRAAI